MSAGVHPLGANRPAVSAANAAWRATSYSLTDADPGVDESPLRTVPTLSLDTGLVLERTAGTKGDRLQTLEPRALFLYVPYRDQDDLPVFDSGLPDLNLVQLFRTNRYVGADRVELYTEAYARAHGTPAQTPTLARYAAAAQAAQAAGLGVNAGHDLNRANLADFLRAVPGVLEVSIGHALIGDAIELGIAETVREHLRRRVGLVVLLARGVERDERGGGLLRLRARERVARALLERGAQLVVIGDLQVGAVANAAGSSICWSISGLMPSS